MSCGYRSWQTDYGPDPYVVNVDRLAGSNQNFRTAIWTGHHFQMTLMRLSPCENIGQEIHEDTDQLIRVEQGRALVKMGKCEDGMEFQYKMCQGDVAFIPAGTWHDVVNVGNCPLKLSSVYAPPNHRRGTVHRTKAEAEREEEYKGVR